MNINFLNYKLIFFDFDGVVVDTEWQHFSAFNSVLKNYGIKITKKEYMEEYLAYDDKGCFIKVFKNKLNKNLSKEEIQSLIKQKTEILMNEIKKKIKVYHDTIKFINFISKKFKDIKLCIVSGALRSEIVFILKKLKLDKKFFLIISAEDVRNGKPSPEPFLLAKQKAESMLNKRFNKNEILVIEDSINGIKSALDAGFDVLAVAHTYPVRKLQLLKPNFVVKSLDVIINS